MERVDFGGGGYGSGLVTIGRSGSGRHNAGWPDFFACQMTEKPWGVHGRGGCGWTKRMGVAGRVHGGMKGVLCLETMPILGYILISILRLDAAPLRKGLPLFIPD